MPGPFQISKPYPGGRGYNKRLQNTQSTRLYSKICENFYIKTILCISWRRMQTCTCVQGKQETLQEFHARSSLSRHTPGPPPRLHSGLRVLSWRTLSSDVTCSKHCRVTVPHGILHIRHYHALPTKAKTQFSWSFPLEDS